MSNSTSLKISIEPQSAATVVSVAGRLDFEAAAGFQHALEQAVSGGGTPPGAVIVDCSALDYVSSAGLRAFLIGARAAQTADVRFSACGLSSQVQEVFQISGFDRLIATHPDRAAALAALA